MEKDPGIGGGLLGLIGLHAALVALEPAGFAEHLAIVAEATDAGQRKLSMHRVRGLPPWLPIQSVPFACYFLLMSAMPFFPSMPERNTSHLSKNSMPRNPLSWSSRSSPKNSFTRNPE